MLGEFFFGISSYVSMERMLKQKKFCWNILNGCVQEHVLFTGYILDVTVIVHFEPYNDVI